eukprot:CCRYP_013230-RA/>CCRYP_013230-RA protein AED:0.16 eAED:0.00 QI:0/0/0/1/0/0/2/0/214
MNSASTKVHSSDRKELCNWGYHIIAACSGVDRSTAVVAISYFDRFLSTSSPFAKCALNDTSLKVHSVFDVKLNFVSSVLCDGLYDTREIGLMEIEVLKALEWRLNGPIPHDFIDKFLHLLPLEPIHFKCLSFISKALSEKAHTMYPMALAAPSALAFASIFCSLQYMSSASPLTNLSILHIADVIPGLNISNRQVRVICRRMVPLIQEVSCNYF